jgi:hypothetical protein
MAQPMMVFHGSADDGLSWLSRCWSFMAQPMLVFHGSADDGLSWLSR